MKMEVVRSIRIEKPTVEVYAVVSDLAKWRPWNPWLITEPEAEVQVDPDGKAYRWSGTRTGSGEMRVTGEMAPSCVELDLLFFKPFKSRAKVTFTLDDDGGACEVTWKMQTNMPFFFFFMTKTMSTLIGMDYERGLSMLKDFIEMGTVPSRIEVAGESEFPGCHYVGITRECEMSELGEMMGHDFERLSAWQRQEGVHLAGDAFSAYQKWDVAHGQVRYTCGIPVEGVPPELPPRFEQGDIPPMKTFVLDHVGAYRHLGNAWSCAMQMGRSREIKVSRAYAPFETYPSGSAARAADAEGNLRTSIHFAIK